jgi:hypothetical protein
MSIKNNDEPVSFEIKALNIKIIKTVINTINKTAQI